MKIISGETSLVGVIGSPVKHSLSPVMHNAALEAMDLNWCYLAIPCETKNLNEVINALGEINCKGLNITIPHKEKTIHLCKTISVIANQVGAINTLIPNNKGGWDGDNTDVEGFLAPLKERNLKNKKAILLGCGGSARAVLTGLKVLNFKEIIIIGRQLKKLNHFLTDINLKHSNAQNGRADIKGLTDKDNDLIEHIKNADLIINATPVGMSANQETTSNSFDVPLRQQIWENLQTSTTLYDLIYTPRPTPWLINAAKKGCDTIDGLEMLVQQGAASLKLWSGGKEIPIQIMRKAAESYLHN